jgi:hypothetical protein
MMAPAAQQLAVRLRRPSRQRDYVYFDFSARSTAFSTNCQALWSAAFLRLSRRLPLASAGYVIAQR